VVEFAVAEPRAALAEGADPARARDRAQAALGEDPDGLRSEFVTPVGTYQELTG
jgi:Ca-activated chloride channel family protein